MNKQRIKNFKNFKILQKLKISIQLKICKKKKNDNNNKKVKKKN